MKSESLFFKGTLLLTFAGFLSRIIGFFYRIFLSHIIGARGIGLYQLVLPLQGLVLALTTTGIQTALSRLIAGFLAVKEEKKAGDCFLYGTVISFFLSCLSTFFIYRHAEFFAVKILKESSSLFLIRILCLSFPFSSLHNCINSFYFARKKVGFPAGMQLLEQLVRVGSSLLLVKIFRSSAIPVSASIAAMGALCSELVTALFSLIAVNLYLNSIHYHVFPFHHVSDRIREISSTAVPMTLNRLLLTVLGSIETILIPSRLCMFGLDSGESLSIYGIFTGMALPLILFPTALTNSASVMLMPSVAQMQALGRKKHIRDVTIKTCKSCILLGSACFIFFFFSGSFLGSLLFGSITAGTYIKMLSFICPFLYMNTALSSILHGLGRTSRCLIHNILGILLRIITVFFIIPRYGMNGYLYGLLCSEVLLSVLHIYSLFI